MKVAGRLGGNVQRAEAAKAVRSCIGLQIQPLLADAPAISPHQHRDLTSLIAGFKFTK